MLGRLKWLVSAVSLFVAMALGVASALGATTANVWVDANGGTCARSASTVSYNDAAACTPNGGWQAATAGDLVLMKSGSYGPTRFTAKTGAANPRVVVQPETNADVAFEWIQLAGASYLTVQAPQANHRFQVIGNGGVGVPGHDSGSGTQWTTKTATLDGFTVNALGTDVGLTIVWINGNTDGLTLDHFDVCCTKADTKEGMLVYVDSDPSHPLTNDNLTIQNSFLHDITQASPSVHSECLWLTPAHTVTVRNNVFRQCAGTADVEFARTNGTSAVTNPSGFVLENNVFGVAHNASGGRLAYSIQGCWFPDTTFRNNLFEADLNNSDSLSGTQCGPTYPVGTPAGTATFINNIGYHGSCATNAVYLKNSWSTVRCGVTADNPANANVLTASNFVTYSGDTFTQAPPYDFTPASGSVLVNTGATGNWAKTDLLGRTRCPGATTTWTCTAGSETGSAPDVGPVERGATS